MARRGARPKPAHLHLVEATVNVTKHGPEKDVRRRAETHASSFGKIVRPKTLTGEAATAWKRYIAPASWLDASREPIAIAFCELWKEFRFAPTQFQASRHSQMRAYMSELGLTDERNRLLDESAEDKDEFLDE
jgi:hypothetical protein